MYLDACLPVVRDFDTCEMFSFFISTAMHQIRVAPKYCRRKLREVKEAEEITIFNADDILYLKHETESYFFLIQQFFTPYLMN